MRAVTVMVAGLVSLAVPAQAQVQMPDGSVNRAAMEKVRFLEGRWRGDAWWQRGPGDRTTATMVEKVERKLDGVALLIEGRGTAALSGGGERVVHHALAVLTWDEATKSYVMRSWIANGQAGDFPVTVTADAISWSRQTPGGTVRNTARFTATEWHEVGELSRDGKTWTPIMELKLRKEP